MGRPTTDLLTFFSVDCKLFRDVRFRSASEKYGFSLSFAVYIIILSIMYEQFSYYIPYQTEREKLDLLDAVQIGLRGKFMPTHKTISEVIDELVRSGLFSGKHYPKIITSKEIQLFYYKATKDRSDIFINNSYWLLSLAEMAKQSTKHSYYLRLVSQPNNGDKQPENGVNQPENEVKKKENKEENKEKEENALREIFSPDLVFNAPFKYSVEEYKRAGAEYHKSTFLKTVAKKLSWINKNFESICNGAYKDFSQTGKSGIVIKDSDPDFAARNITAEELDDMNGPRLSDDEL